MGELGTRNHQHTSMEPHDTTFPELLSFQLPDYFLEAITLLPSSGRKGITGLKAHRIQGLLYTVERAGTAIAEQAVLQQLC